MVSGNIFVLFCPLNCSSLGKRIRLGGTRQTEHQPSLGFPMLFGGWYGLLGLMFWECLHKKRTVAYYTGGTVRHLMLLQNSPEAKTCPWAHQVPLGSSSFGLSRISRLEGL